jgi:hypothetical protein
MLRRIVVVSILALALAEEGPAQDKPLKIIPGKVIVPTDRMKRIWGELVSLDLKTRTGIFRNESNDELMSFTVLPYAELLHHATFGDLQDFRVGERAIFRLHENDKGEWVWLTYIQDEMNFLNGHKEYYWVEKIDAKQGRVEFTQASADKSFVRQKGLILETDADTRYWKDGLPAKFADIQVGDKLRTQTHGVGKGKTRMCWHVFLDDASLLKFQAEQKQIHQKRMAEQGLPGYIDGRADRELKLTLFQEARESCHRLKAGQKVRLAPAGIDRTPSAAAETGTLTAIQPAGALFKLTITLEAAPRSEWPAGTLTRLWPAP